MHFSLPNNRPLEQGSHWEESDCNLVHQTPKLPAIISSFLHQTQAYTDSKANLSCKTREKRFSEQHIFRWVGKFSILGMWIHPVLTGMLAVKSAKKREATVSFSSTVVCGNKSLGWHGNNMVGVKFSNWVILQKHIAPYQNNLQLGLLIQNMFYTKVLKYFPIAFLIWLLVWCWEIKWGLLELDLI